MPIIDSSKEHDDISRSVVEGTQYINRIIIVALAVVTMALCGVIWASLTSQISRLNDAVSLLQQSNADLKGLTSQIINLNSDVRVLQQSNSDLRVIVQDLKTRVSELVGTLNDRPIKRHDN